MTRWLDPTPVEIPASFSGLDLHPLVAQTLLRRGIQRPEEVEAFLHPEATPSTAFPGIETAVSLLREAIRRGDKICVWGDFDVDGQTSTALLVQMLRALQADAIYYIPVRGKESHGVHVDSLKPLIDDGAQVLLTCDTGITAHEAVDYANSRNVTVIITDHHDLGETLPNAHAIVNPKLLPEEHPLRNLAGVGVAYKLAEAMLEGRDPNIELLDLVALGLIADVALLQKETRALAKQGIIQLRSTKRLGLNVMAELAGAALDTLTEETIGFTFAPRLNALGRLSDANPAVELLTTSDSARARVLAAQIEGLNAQRRLLTRQVHEAAEALLHEDPDLLNQPAILLAHPNWPGGVVGIVANKLVERYHKPALLFSESEDGILRGSARSIEGLHITEAIATQKDRLLGFGGHPMAAGMSLHKENLTAFRKGLGRAIEGQLGSIVFEEPTLQIDAWLGLSDLTLDLADSLDLLAPFGAGNPELTLATRNVTLKSVREIGKTKEHLRLNVEDEHGEIVSFLWWGGAGEDLPPTGARFDIAYSLRANSYRGQRQVTLQFQDFRITEEKPVEVKETRLEVRDMRLQSATLNLQPSTLIWAEGADRSAGRTRNELHPADELTIYTAPPSPAELKKALEIVQPKVAYVFAIPPAEETPEEFLTHLAGLCKFVLNQRRGETTIPELAAAMAARDAAVHLGLEWLGAGGQLSVRVEAGQVFLTKETRGKNPYLQAELHQAIKGVLSETAAYRKYLTTVTPLHL
ncbi:MAG TPA: single-stranded-DNA-specific exonuclease RecJ [Anaerolineales bacterium]|nr:single-stranded-DNA-specific exonuclease RecJ [Anaerolineales bacterium]HNO30333.1 single-stranded-DNA-specific exonuclease RecJ [Anaerolineales bacterium]